jgi:hypothetical protein
MYVWALSEGTENVPVRKASVLNVCCPHSMVQYGYYHYQYVSRSHHRQSMSGFSTRMSDSEARRSESRQSSLKGAQTRIMLSGIPDLEC